MTIKAYLNAKGETVYEVYVQRSSKQAPIRVQRRKRGIDNLKDAQREQKQLADECVREVQTKETQGATLRSLIDQFDSYLASDEAQILHEATRKDYVATASKHLDAWLSRPAATITNSELRMRLTQLVNEGYSVGHVSKLRGVLMKIFDYGMERGIIRGLTNNPARAIKLKKQEEKRPEILTVEQIKKLLQEAKAHNHPWYPVWVLALLTGMRNGELYALLQTDIDLEKNVIVVSKSYNCATRSIKCTKAGYWRYVPISSELRNFLIELKESTKNQKEVLPRMWKWDKGEQARVLKQFCIGIGLPPIKFHTLRACFATQLIRAGVAPIQIQKICGWVDLKTMQIYIRLAGIELEGVTEALRLLP